MTLLHHLLTLTLLVGVSLSIQILPKDDLAQSDIIVKTSLGPIKGILVDGQVPVAEFKGIPYAEPPIGERRFAPPEPKKPWGPKTFDASNFGYICPQNGHIAPPNDTMEMSEDCLYLNIWTPVKAIPSYKSLQSKPLPVMVYIHGGGWIKGYGSDPSFYGNFIANSTDTILVNFNYRLGAFGFLVSDELGGNYGLKDQQQALTWVQENIAAFGGDPSRVTIFGQSAGGISVTMQLTLPSNIQKPLFHRAIIQSNPFSILLRRKEQSLPYAREFAYYLNCDVKNVTCLREKNTVELLEAQAKVIWIPFPITSQDILPWQPTIDDTYIVGQPLDLIEQGKIVNVSGIILGTVENETLPFIEQIPVKFNAVEYEALVTLWFGLSNFADLWRVYPPVFIHKQNALSILTADLYFVCSTRRAAKLFASHNISTHLYNFIYAPQIDVWNRDEFCAGEACHSIELPYVFHTQGFYNVSWESSGAEELSWKALDYWTSFAHSEELEDWPRYDPNVDESLLINLQMSVRKGYHQKGCEIWDRLGYYGPSHINHFIAKSIRKTLEERH